MDISRRGYAPNMIRVSYDVDMSRAVAWRRMEYAGGKYHPCIRSMTRPICERIIREGRETERRDKI